MTKAEFEDLDSQLRDAAATWFRNDDIQKLDRLLSWVRKQIRDQGWADAGRSRGLEESKLDTIENGVSDALKHNTCI